LFDVKVVAEEELKKLMADRHAWTAWFKTLSVQSASDSLTL
jgi:hypothetical protein